MNHDLRRPAAFSAFVAIRSDKNTHKVPSIGFYMEPTEDNRQLASTKPLEILNIN